MPPQPWWVAPAIRACRHLALVYASNSMQSRCRDADTAHPGALEAAGTATPACPGLCRYKEDVALMKQLGMKHYRCGAAAH
jgi:beta-glucosidase/6-phospho-beta-glucosidase/beta-galactosidase